MFMRCWLMGLLVCAFPAAICAEEPVESFLQALSDRGYYEEAVIYLDTLVGSALIDESTSQQLAFRRGTLLLDQSRQTKNLAQRRKRLSEAKVSFTEFLDRHPEHPNSSLARKQLATILVEDAREMLRAANDSSPRNPDQIERANAVFDQALAMLETSRQQIENRLKELTGSTESESRAEQSKLREDYVQTKIAKARILFEQAESLEQEPPRYRAKLEEAILAFDDIATKYRKYSAGLYATLYQGECYQKLGDHKRALSFFEELRTTQDNSGPIRKLKTMALSRAMPSWIADSEDGYQQAIDQAKDWISKARGNEMADPEWISLRLELAKALLHKADAVNDETQARRARKEARDIVNEVARRRSPQQAEAQAMLLKFQAPDENDTSTKLAAEITADTSFSEAFAQAKQSIDELKLSESLVKLVTAQLQSVTDTTAKNELQEKLAAAQDRYEDEIDRSIELLETSMELAKPEDQTELNGLRYYLAYLYFREGNYHRAAVLAEFVARRHPDSPAAKECATVALAAHQQILAELSGTARDDQAVRVANVAGMLASRWPEQGQNASAIATIVDVMVGRGEIDKAIAAVEKVPESSAGRGDAELVLGRALWSLYLTKANQPDNQAGETERNEMKRQATEYLATGLQRINRDAPNEAIIRSALSLAQIYADSEDASAAFDLLQDDRIGALALSEAGSAWLDRIPGLETEAYKTAIRAHVSSAGTSDDPAASIEQATALLDELKSKLADDPEADQKLIAIYVGLAQDLQRQIRNASGTSKAALMKGFELFLSNASESTNDVTIQNWVASTLFDLGETTADDAKSKYYFSRSIEAYDRLLSAIETNETKQSLVLASKLKQAMALRNVLQFPKAIQAFQELLAVKSKVLSFQIEAAKTYQQWGDAGDSSAYLSAVRGALPDASGSNQAWGWGRIAFVLGRPEFIEKKPEFREAFHQARRNVAYCHYRYGLATNNADYLVRARADIESTRNLYPELGGQRSKAKYEQLLASINRSIEK